MAKLRKSTKAQPKFIRTNNGIISIARLGAIRLTDTGVAIFDANGDIKHWHPENDTDKAKCVAKTLSDSVMASQSTETQPKFVRTEYGLFSVENLGAITMRATGVAVTDTRGEMRYWHSEGDPQKAQQVANALTDSVMGLQNTEVQSKCVRAIDGLFSIENVDVITITKTGVAVTDLEGGLRYWHSENDPEEAKQVANDLTKAVMKLPDSDIKSKYVHATNGMFSIENMDGITKTETGVVVIDLQGNVKYWHPESDPVKAQEIAQQLSEAAMNASANAHP